MSKKIGRNEKCPCGSGKKYKQCCLSMDEAAARAAIQLAPGDLLVFDDDDLEELSNGVLDQIRRGDFEGAEAACRRLSVEYPDQIDGIDRLALVREAQGRLAEAAELFRQAAAFAATHPGFEAESVRWFLAEAARLEGRT